MSDTSSVLLWWFTIFLTGLVFLPITFSLFRKFIDRGYIFSKVLGIVLSSYLVWLLASTSLLPFTRLTIIIVFIALVLVNLWSLAKNHKQFAAKLPLGLFIFEEVMFFAALAFWSYVRATEPSIRGLEKFMDFGFVNSILRSNFFPPLDMWLTRSPDYTGGYFINYYYFGHYITAFLTKFSGIDSIVTYNLMLATLFAFTFTLPFSIGMNLFYLLTNTLIFKMGDARRGAPSAPQRILGVEHALGLPSSRTHKLKCIMVGLLAAFLVALGGNLHTLYVFTTGYPNENPEPPWKLSLGFHPERYWYPNATRFIPFTIHEFPIYSFVVADLHGHVSDIPMVFTTIAILLTLVVKDKKQKEDKANNFLSEFENHTNIPLLHVLLLGLFLAVMYMTNAWDGLIYMVLAGLVILVYNLTTLTNQSWLGKIYKTFSASLFLLFTFLIANLPFSLNFKPFVSGIGVLCAPKSLLEKKLGPFIFETGKCQKSPLYMLATLWGFFYYNVVGYFLFVILPNVLNKSPKHQAPNSKQATNSKHQIPNKKFKFLNFGHLNLFGNWNLGFGNLTNIDIFILRLILLSTLLLIFPEFFYIKDIYPAHYRANTMFKLGYQAFMMLGLCSVYIIFRIRLANGKNLLVRLYSAFFILLFTLVAIYPYFAINSYYGRLQTYYGLYGLNWFATQYQDDYQAVEWLRKNIPDNTQPVIVEANGDSYTDYARVSANTGLLTIVGWPVHEWLWRGSYDEAGKRIPEVVAIYESKDIEATKQILKKYNVEYIFVGALEREKYKQMNEEKLDQLGKVVFESGETKIYKVNSSI